MRTGWPSNTLQNISQVSLGPHRGRRVVVLHSDHHLLVHGQPGCVPHRGEDGVAHRERRGSGQTDRDRLRDARLRINQRVFYGKRREGRLQTSISGSGASFDHFISEYINKQNDFYAGLDWYYHFCY